MANKGKHVKKQGGKFFPALCRTVGHLVLVAVILTAVPLTLPRLFGYRVYSVVTGSMEPALPAGSLVYVKKADPMTVQAGEIIAFSDDGAVVTHRVVENRSAEGSFITRGDANETNDLFPVSYRNLIGVVRMHIPVLGFLMLYFVSARGKMLAFCAVIGGGLLSVVGGALASGSGKNGDRRT